jgi:hypothetical protein
MLIAASGAAAPHRLVERGKRSRSAGKKSAVFRPQISARKRYGSA